jgi:hypothetical protein
VTISSEGRNLRCPLNALTLVNCLFDVAIAGRDHTEGDIGLGHAHGRSLGAVEVDAGPDDLFGEGGEDTANRRIGAALRET